MCTIGTSKGMESLEDDFMELLVGSERVGGWLEDIQQEGLSTSRRVQRVRQLSDVIFLTRSVRIKLAKAFTHATVHAACSQGSPGPQRAQRRGPHERGVR